MMSYQNDFVLAIMHSGSPVREISGKVTLPFNSEYKIRLKNKHEYLRAKARVWVDGRQASNLGDLILRPGETLDLERFLDESMTSGRRFQFVPLSDRRVNDPTDSENGIIKVEFYREMSIKWSIEPAIKWNNNWENDSLFNLSSGGFSSKGSGLTYGGSSNRTSISTYHVSNIAATPDQAGATVEGSNSNQQFVIGNDFTTEIFPTTLTLKLQGPRIGAVNIGSSSAQQTSTIKFCPSCGARRLRKAGFCHRCGHEFTAKRSR